LFPTLPTGAKLEVWKAFFAQRSPFITRDR
jgi:hypothetical protein